MLGRDRDARRQRRRRARTSRRVIDIVKLGLAYRDDVETDAKFLELERRIKASFAKL